MPIDNLTLKTATFNPVVFNPTTYTPQVADVSILQKSLANRETRMNTAIEKRTALDAALGEVETKLNKAEANWFNNYKNNINQQIQDAVDIGDFGAAIRTATGLAGQTAKDSALLSRIAANEKYIKWTDNIQTRVDKGELSQDAAKWALAMNPYQFNETTDIYGNAIGGSLNNMKQVYNTINWDEVAAKAATFYRPDQKTWDNGGGGNNPALYDSKNNEKLATLNGQIGQASSEWRNSGSLEEVTSENLLDTIGGLLDMPDLKNQAIQDYDVQIWNYQQKLADGTLSNADKRTMIEEGLIRNGSPITLKEYLDNKSKLFVNALAYRKEGNTSIANNGFSFGGTGGGIRNNNSTPADGDYHNPTNYVKTVGPNGEVQVGNYSPDPQTPADKVTNMFTSVIDDK